MNGMAINQGSSLNLQQEIILSGCCVTGPPRMAGLLVPFTAGVMGIITQSQSSKMATTCLEDTLTFLGVTIVDMYLDVAFDS